MQQILLHIREVSDKQLMYAVIYDSSKNITDIENRLNEDMIAKNHYLETNELIINLKKGKTECVLFSTAKRISTFQVKSQELKVYCNNVRINSVTTYTYMGT